MFNGQCTGRRRRDGAAIDKKEEGGSNARIDCTPKYRLLSTNVSTTRQYDCPAHDGCVVYRFVYDLQWTCLSTPRFCYFLTNDFWITDRVHIVQSSNNLYRNRTIFFSTRFLDVPRTRRVRTVGASHYRSSASTGPTRRLFVKAFKANIFDFHLLSFYTSTLDLEIDV